MFTSLFLFSPFVAPITIFIDFNLHSLIFIGLSMKMVIGATKDENKNGITEINQKIGRIKSLHFHEVVEDIFFHLFHLFLSRQMPS